ncbi:MAG: hypothetical protein J7M18_06120, partial [Candidatus Eremiobacteraeota bacterium]|nr:hypothetical protein [Candidatus Eremiobacteraeota bacterium]
KYVVQACMLPLVQKFLEDESTSKFIGKLGNFEKVTIDLRYIRVYQFLGIRERISLRTVMNEIKTLVRLADKIEALQHR